MNRWAYSLSTSGWEDASARYRSVINASGRVTALVARDPSNCQTNRDPDYGKNPVIPPRRARDRLISIGKVSSAFFRMLFLESPRCAASRTGLPNQAYEVKIYRGKAGGNFSSSRTLRFARP